MKYLLIGLMLISANVTRADIFKCENNKGNITYQDSPCDGSKPLAKATISKEDLLTPAGGTSKIDAAITKINAQFTRKKIAIEGDSKYKNQITKCLNLIRNHSKEDYSFVVKHIGIIKQHPKSGMFAWKSPPVFQMSNKSAFHSLTWCAGGIAHDAYHSYLFRENKVEGEKYPPYETWGGFSAEKKCIQYQISVMRKIGGSESDIKYLEAQDGTHGDTNKDGKLDHRDREGITW